MAPIRVRPAEVSEQSAALRLLMGESNLSSPRALETRAAAERGELSLRELMLAEVAGQPVGAGLFTEQPGRVGFVWPPGVAADHPLHSAIQDAILAAIARRLDELSLCFGQVILDPGEGALREVLSRNGFGHLTDLHYMVCAPGSVVPVELSPRHEMETFDASGNSERFAIVLKRTYANTLDCPELDGLRTAEEALAAHRSTGRFDPSRWWLFRDGGRDAGLLLLNEHPEGEFLEIVYLGVVPEARGKALGQHMLQQALIEGRQNRQSLVLAVDARNHFARRIYQRAGFLDVTVQSVHLRQPAGNALNPPFTNYAQAMRTGKRNS